MGGAGPDHLPPKPNVFGGSGTDEERHSTCTPEWLAKLIGKVRLDPCSNPRSHIESVVRCMLENGGDGLWKTPPGEFCIFERRPGSFCTYDETHGLCLGMADEAYDVFINPPYGRGEVEKWIEHYGHTRFIFLLKWSPDTEWFAQLLPKCDYIWFPLVRCDFEPPPGVTFSSNPLPHALYLRNPSEELLGRLRGAGWLLKVDRELLDWVAKNWQTWKHEHRQTVRGNRKGTKGKGGARRSGGGVRRARRGKTREADADDPRFCRHGVWRSDECSSCFYER